MIKLGRVSTLTRGPSADPLFYEDIVSCADGGQNLRTPDECPA